MVARYLGRGKLQYIYKWTLLYGSVIAPAISVRVAVKG